jgi:ferredoxin-like protein FixX
MSDIRPITVNVAQYLGLNKYEVDEEDPHIKLVDAAPLEEFMKLVRVCPAALYKVDEDGNESFDYAGCLECGTCRIAALGSVVESWRYPGPTMGVEYRYG